MSLQIPTAPWTPWQPQPNTLVAVALISYGRRLTALAEQDPDRPAITCGEQSITRVGARIGGQSACPRPGSQEASGKATWSRSPSPTRSTGSLPLRRAGRSAPSLSRCRPSCRARELQAILELADPSAVIGVPAELAGGRRTLPAGYRPDPDLPDDPLPDVISPAWKAPTSGGSTGRPKLIVSGDPALCDPDAPPLFGRADGCMVVPAPLYHNGPIVWSCSAWLAGSHVVVLPRFDAEATLRGHRPVSGRHRLPGAHHDEADLAAARRGPRLLRPVVSVSPSGIWPNPARHGSSRSGSTGSGRTASSSSTRVPRHRRPPSSPGPNGSPTAVRSAGPRRAPS